MEYRRLGDFVENYPPGLFRLQSESIVKVPGDGFPFTVFIGREPDQVRLPGKVLQFLDHLLLVRRDHIFRLEAMLHIDAQLLVLKVAYMPEAGLHRVFFAEIFLYGPRLCRRLDYYEIPAHPSVTFMG